jgi:hypothetical protein
MAAGIGSGFVTHHTAALPERRDECVRMDCGRLRATMSVNTFKSDV